MAKPKTPNPNPDTHDYCARHADWVPIPDLLAEKGGKGYRNICRDCWKQYMHDRRMKLRVKKEDEKLAKAYDKSDKAGREVEAYLTARGQKLQGRIAMQEFLRVVVDHMHPALTDMGRVCEVLWNASMPEGTREPLTQMQTSLQALTAVLEKRPDAYGGVQLAVVKTQPSDPARPQVTPPKPTPEPERSPDVPPTKVDLSAQETPKVEQEPTGDWKRALQVTSSLAKSGIDEKKVVKEFTPEEQEQFPNCKGFNELGHPVLKDDFVEDDFDFMMGNPFDKGEKK